MRLTPRETLAVIAGFVLFVLSCSRSVSGPEPMQRWEIVPTLTIGGAEDGPTAFSDIRGLEIDDQGRILVFEYATQQIEMFDSNGTHLRTIGRKGMGPGELNNANGMVRGQDGTYWLSDPGNNRVTVFGPEGELVRTIPVSITSYGYLWEAWFEQDGSLHELIGVRQDTSWVTHIQRFRNGGQRIDTLPGPVPCDGMLPRPSRDDNFVITYRGGYSVMGIPFKPSPIRKFDGRGHAWCGVSSEYSLRRVGFEPGDTLILQGPRTAAPVTEAERDSVIGSMQKRLKKMGAADPDWSRLPTVKPVIDRVVVDDSLRVWVNPVLPGPKQTWDVFREDGRPVAVATAPTAFHHWLPIHFRGDQIYGVIRDSNDVQTVFRGRIRRTS